MKQSKSRVASTSILPVYITFDDGMFYVIEYSLEKLTMPVVAAFKRNPTFNLSIVYTTATSETICLLGDMCDGEIIKVNFTENEIIRAGLIENYAPVIDSKLAEHKGRGPSFYVTCGHGTEGAVKEFRRGILVEPRLALDDIFARVLLIDNDELVDISEASGFDVDKPTLFSGDSVLVTMPYMLKGFERNSGAYIQRWIPDDGDKIVMATQIEERVIVSLSRSHELLILKVLTDGSTPDATIIATSRIQMSEDLSCLFPLMLSIQDRSLPCVVTGSFAPSVKVLDIDSLETLWDETLKSSLCFARIGERVDYNHKAIGVRETPRRVLYDNFLGKLIVACVVDGPDGNSGIIKVIDPISSTENHVEYLEQGEVCYSLAVWNVKEGKRYICIGTGGSKSNSGTSAEGRILSRYRMRKLGEYKFPSNVTAITPFMSSYLLVAAGSTLCQLKIDAATRTLVAGAQVTVLSPIQSISISSGTIFVGCIRNSIQMYTYDYQTKSFKFVAGDRELRVTSDCTSYYDNTVLGTDKYGDFFGLKEFMFKTERRGEVAENCLENEFSFTLGEVVLRLNTGTLFRDFESKNKEMCAISYQPVHGFSVIGSLFSFYPISAETFGHFKVLCDILMKLPKTKPLLGNLCKVNLLITIQKAMIHPDLDRASVKQLAS
ncbi:hypothetical protein HDU67_008486 [Dinochytrium kinnereticum]|nr:hypothetical protein HDU67_008486 [Dinochytrium kinnereticum]